ncbi:MAG TPA: hypothetical protein PKC30_09010 [Saprospiraceae bacterium]|nr:hypothetical protein [Saprospiraceae bacterium]
MKIKTIKGNVVYVPIEGGFWGVMTKKNRNYLPMEMPESLKKDGIEVTLKVRMVKDAVTMFMWGLPVEIIEYKMV